MVDLSSSLGQILRATAEKFGSKKALFFKCAGKYDWLTWRDVRNRTDAVASFLITQDLQPGDRVAILSENRPEWVITDMACATVGSVTVPIYPSLTANEILYILLDSSTKFIAVSGKLQFEKIRAILPQLPGLKGILVYEASLLLEKRSETDPLFLFSEAERTALHPELELRFRNVRLEDTASLIYTSGTTGAPKGVMLTHGNFLHNVTLCKDTLRMGESDSHLSFLPLCHVFERTAGYYLMVSLGASIAYAENLDTVPKNILEVKPTFLLGVPRFFEKIQTKVVEALKKAGPIRHGVFYWAKELGRKKRQGEKISFTNRLLMPLANALVYKKFNSGLGGRLRFCVSGGAALPKEIAEFFCDLGLMIYEGYGLTETSPVISVNREEKFRFGSVGVPLDSVQVRITEEGEIITKSACVMKGYFGKPAETDDVLKDGWFYTGDLGHIDQEGFLFITGRKKDLIVTSGGKKISPRPIEELLESDPYILRCVLFGEGKKFLTALIVPESQALTEYAGSQKIAFSHYSDLLKNKKIIEFLDSRIQSLMKDFASYEKIKYFHLLDHDFGLASGELTPTLKVRRSVVWSRYQEPLLKLYEMAHD